MRALRAAAAALLIGSALPADALEVTGRCSVTFGAPLHPDRAEEPRDFAARLSAAIASLAVT